MTKTILVVDDEPLLLEVISFAIEDEGYKTMTANSVDEALKVIDENKIDAILSDVRMPKKNGVDFIKAVMARPEKIPFTFMSGFSELDDKSAKALGAISLIAKPIDLAQMPEILKAMFP